MKVLRKLLVRAGTGQLRQFAGRLPRRRRVVAAGRRRLRAEPMLPTAAAAATPRRVIDPAELPDFSPERFGSNAVGLGSDLTGGAGALLGNPHFPWFGIERFYAVHLTIPGRYDVDGRVDLRLPAGQHRLQPQRGLEPYGLDGTPLRAARTGASRRGSRRRTSYDGAGASPMQPETVTRRRAAGRRQRGADEPHLLADAVRAGRWCRPPLRRGPRRAPTRSPM